MRRPWLVPLILITAAAGGCGNNGGGGDDGTTVDSPTTPPGYTRLIGRTWSLAPGQHDVYKCVRFTVDHDVYVTGFQSQAPNGSHHAVLSISDSRTAGPDGEYDCSVGTLGLHMLFASGVGTGTYDFPDQVGIKITAGTQLHLNLHLYNASDGQLDGDSAVLVKASDTPPPMLAEFVFAGAFLFNISGTMPNQTQTASGGCTVSTSFNLFALWPHMHQLATHQKVELIRGGVPQVLHDAAFSFGEQKFYSESPIVQVQSGDQIRVTCSWINNTGTDVHFGDSSDAEMCFSGMYRYPVTASNLFECTDTRGTGFM